MWQFVRYIFTSALGSESDGPIDQFGEREDSYIPGNANAHHRDEDKERVEHQCLFSEEGEAEVDEDEILR